MIVFKLEGGFARGGKTAAMARDMQIHQMLRREAAFHAAATYIGLDPERLWVDADPDERARVALVHSITPADRFSVELDGSPVWRGWWEWSANGAHWHEEGLTDWMRASIETMGREVPT